MHVGRMLARLNPSTVRFDVGRGGTPELTSQDIAAALGMVRNRLGAEVMHYVWQGYPMCGMPRLDALIADVQLGEWRRLADRMLNAQIAVAAATDRAHERRARIMLDDAKAAMWPALGPIYGRIRLGTLVELQRGRRCDDCGGRGYVMDGSRRMPCGSCGGIGLSANGGASDRMRAEALERSHTTYARIWSPVYEWTMQACTQAMEDAAYQFRNALQ